MQLVYFIELAEVNQNIYVIFTVTDSVNLMKNRPLVAKKLKEIAIRCKMQYTQ